MNLLKRIFFNSLNKIVLILFIKKNNFDGINQYIIGKIKMFKIDDIQFILNIILVEVSKIENKLFIILL